MRCDWSNKMKMLPAPGAAPFRRRSEAMAGQADLDGVGDGLLPGFRLRLAAAGQIVAASFLHPPQYSCYGGRALAIGSAR